jgi:hypothetical protein
MSPHGEMDIIFGFEPKVESSNLSGGTLRRVKYKHSKIKNKTMKKYILITLFLVSFLIPTIAGAAIVPCGNTNPCQLNDFFTMLTNIYVFIVLNIATPLAILSLVIGGIFILISAGNPSLATRGKQIVWMAVIGLALVFASWVIIKTILTAIGYNGTF